MQQPVKMTGFSDLPDELVLMIVAPFLGARNMVRLWRPGRSQSRSEYYYQDERRKVIVNLSTTCRGLRRLLGGYVNEFIYLDCTFPRTMRLLRAVSGNGAAFRSTTKYHVQIVPSKHEFDDPEDLIYIRKAALDAGLGDEFDRICSSRLPGAPFYWRKLYFMLLLILRRLVNVQSIALPEFMHDSLRVMDLNKLSLELHSLRSIHLLLHHGTVTFGTQKSRVTFIPARIRHKINDLRVHLPDVPHGFELKVLPFPMLKSLSVKGISGFDACYSSLDRALAGLEHLETFACDEYLRNASSAKPDEIVEMLAKHNSKTLTKLVLADLAESGDVSKMRLSFRGLPNLTDLYLDMDTLIGAMGELEFDLWASKPQGTRHDDQLQSLRRLHVSRPVGWRVEGKLRWLEQTVAAGSFPCLRELTVDSFDRLEPNRADVMKAGVVFYKASSVHPGEW
ncbi:hypothetical protein CMUS01_12922 [Colletotrichum musicola]|uniref:Uncharacterized protein n=1 Tax=Colletotrichum musicola TaxID=2175873 RepID=A0A8H6MXU3_9PEZI|nr:hypothetical protein CMUS01_12922 [Colletotrichum musicola]